MHDKDSKYTMEKIRETASIPAVRIVIETIDGAITTRETDIVKASYSQPTVCANIHKVLLFPSLHQEVKDLINVSFDI